MKMFSPLCYEDPVSITGLFNDHLIDDAHGFLYLRMQSCLFTPCFEGLQDSLRPFIKTALQYREKFLVGRKADRTGNICEYRPLQQSDIDHMETDQLRVKALGYIYAI